LTKVHPSTGSSFWSKMPKEILVLSRAPARTRDIIGTWMSVHRFVSMTKYQSCYVLAMPMYCRVDSGNRVRPTLD
jgi:hypothetical protein